MAPPQIANDVLFAAILVALPVSPRQFLEWTRLERLAFLTGLALQSEWRRRPFSLKTFGRLLQIPRLMQPRPPLPSGLISFWQPTTTISIPVRGKLTPLERRRLIRRQAGAFLRPKIRRQNTH
jgi:hypothetical protein